MVDGHAVVGERVHAGLDGRETAIGADFGAFAGDQIFGGEDQVVGDARLRKFAERRAARAEVSRASSSQLRLLQSAITSGSMR